LARGKKDGVADRLPSFDSKGVKGYPYKRRPETLKGKKRFRERGGGVKKLTRRVETLLLKKVINFKKGGGGGPLELSKRGVTT